MKRSCLTACLGLVLFAAAAAAATNSVPYTNSFEGTGTAANLVGGTAGYTNGQTVVTNTAGWYAEDVDYGIVSAETYTYFGALPIPTNVVDHEQVLNVSDGAVSNLFDSGSEDNVWVDMMINATVWDLEESGEPDIPTNEVRTAIYVDTNGYLVTFGGYYDEGIFDFVYGWYTLNHSPLASNDWARLTFHYDRVGEEGFPVYQLALNGSIITDARAYDRSDGTGNTWWFTRYQAQTALSSLTISGATQLDDYQIVVSDPLSGVTNYTIAATVNNNEGATIDPDGNIPAAEGSDLAFAIAALSGYSVTNVWVDYSGFTGWVGATNSYTMTNIMADGAITVYATEDAGGSATIRGTPYSFYDDHPDYTTSGWEEGDYEAADLQDLDNDGKLAWEEYFTGTDPRNSNSVFRVLDVGYHGASNVVWFYATTNYGAPEMWSMYRSVSLTNGWDLISTNDIDLTVIGVGGGTNEWWDMDAPGTAPVFYLPTSRPEE